MQWEYNSIAIKIGRLDDVPCVDEGVRAKLDRLGEEGWELVSVVPVAYPTGVLGVARATKGAIAWFKRPKEGV